MIVQGRFHMRLVLITDQQHNIQKMILCCLGSCLYKQVSLNGRHFVLKEKIIINICIHRHIISTWIYVLLLAKISPAVSITFTSSPHNINAVSLNATIFAIIIHYYVAIIIIVCLTKPVGNIAFYIDCMED